MRQSKSLVFDYRDVRFAFQIDSNESIISQNVATTGVWEENQLSLYPDIIGERGVFLDIGANVGINSLFAKRCLPYARVIAVEPEPRNFDLLKINVTDSGVEVQNLAIADRDDYIGFAGTGTNAHIATDGEQQVRCVPLDSLVEKLDLQVIDLLKVDVEGYTDMVLSRAKRTLSITKNAIIEFSHGDIVSRLRSLGEMSNNVAVIQHSEMLFDHLRSHFTYFYYISRHDGLVALSDTSDLFEIMFSEAVVGDILASRMQMRSISACSFAFRAVVDLKQQNHQRIVEIQKLQTQIQELQKRD